MNINGTLPKKTIVIEDLPHGLSAKSFVESLFHFVGETEAIDIYIALEHYAGLVHYCINLYSEKSKVFDLSRFLMNYGIEIPLDETSWILLANYDPTEYPTNDDEAD